VFKPLLSIYLPIYLSRDVLGALPWVIREEMPLQGKPELPWQDFKHPKLEKLIKIYKNGGLLRFLTRFISLIFIVRILCHAT